MADEAVVRIVLERGGMGSEFAPPDIAPPPPSAFPFEYQATAPPQPFQFDYGTTAGLTPNEQLQQSLIKQARARLDKLRESLVLDELYANELANAPDIEQLRIDLAKKRLRAEEEAAAVEAEYQKLAPEVPTLDLSPLQKAKDRLKREQELAEVEAEYNKIAPPVLELTPLQRAKDRLKREQELAEIDAEYAKIAPADVIPVFDPVDRAKERRKREIERDQVDKAYNDLYGEDEPESGPFDDLINTAGKLRGTIGGRFGQLAGSALDVMAGMKRLGAGGAGGTAGAAGGASGLAATAGPVALAVIAAEEVNKAVRGAIKSVVGAHTDIATTIASPSSNPAEPIAKLGDAASKAGEHLGGFGHGIVLVGEQLKGLSAVMQAIDATAQRYGEFSPEIAQAQAIAEVRQTMGDFRRAQQVSSEMAKFVMAQSDVQQRFEDIKVRLLTQMLPLISGLLRTVETIMAAGEGTAKAVEVLARPLTAIASAAAEIVGIEKDKQMPDIEDPTAQILGGGFFDVKNNLNPKGFVPNL